MQAMSKPPSRIRISPDEYVDIEIVDSTAGEMETRIAIIEQVFIHCLHATADQNSAWAIARELLSLFRNNPDLMAYLLAKD
jgi:hypothetical protein